MARRQGEGAKSAELSAAVIEACAEVHRHLGPGLLESAYEQCLAHELGLRGLRFERQRPVSLEYKGLKVEHGYRLHLVVEDALLVEIKAAERLLPVHEAQVQSFLRLTGLPAGLLVNFHETVLRTGVRRIAPSEPSLLASHVRFPGAARWEDVRICILYAAAMSTDKNLVRIDVGGRSYRCTPADLGMAHPRSRHPTLVWEALMEICDHKGVFKTRRFGGIDATKKLVSRLRAQLKVLFGLTQSPFYRYRRGMGWHVRFIARPDLPGEGDDD